MSKEISDNKELDRLGQCREIWKKREEDYTDLVNNVKSFALGKKSAEASDFIYDVCDRKTKVKTWKSLEQNLKKSLRESASEKSLPEIFYSEPDIAGVRIITYFFDNGIKVLELFNESDRFQVESSSYWATVEPGLANEIINRPNDKLEGVKDKIDIRSKRDGYESFHLIVKASKDNLKKNPKFESLKCEIQIRTITRESWGELSHPYAYKPEEELLIDKTEDFASLSHIIHAADRLLMKIRDEVESEKKSLIYKLKKQMEKIYHEEYSFEKQELEEGLFALNKSEKDVDLEDHLGQRFGDEKTSEIVDKIFGIHESFLGSSPNVPNLLKSLKFVERNNKETAYNFLKYDIIEKEIDNIAEADHKKICRMYDHIIENEPDKIKMKLLVELNKNFDDYLIESGQNLSDLFLEPSKKIWRKFVSDDEQSELGIETIKENVLLTLNLYKEISEGKNELQEFLELFLDDKEENALTNSPKIKKLIITETCKEQEIFPHDFIFKKVLSARKNTRPKVIVYKLKCLLRNHENFSNRVPTDEVDVTFYALLNLLKDKFGVSSNRMLYSDFCKELKEAVKKISATKKRDSYLASIEEAMGRLK